MCKFKIKCRLERYICRTFYNGCEYLMFIAYPASFAIPVLIPCSNVFVKVGDYIISEDAELTHKRKYPGRCQELVIVVGQYEVVSPDLQIEEVDYLPVVTSGELVKTNKAQIQKIGESKFDFIACSLSITNADLWKKYCLLVAFRREAREIDSLGNGTSVTVYARLRKCKGRDDFELNVSSVRAEVFKGKEGIVCATV